MKNYAKCHTYIGGSCGSLHRNFKISEISNIKIFILKIIKSLDRVTQLKKQVLLLMVQLTSVCVLCWESIRLTVF